MPRRVLDEQEFKEIYDRTLKSLPAGLKSEEEFARQFKPRLDGAIAEAEHSPAPVRGSAFSRVLSNLPNPIEIVKGGYGLAKDVADSVLHPLAVPNMNGPVASLVKRQVDQATQAKEEFGKGSPVAGVGRAVASVTPLVGPFAAEAADKWVAGDIAGLLTSVGSALAAPAVVRKAGKVIQNQARPLVRSALKPTLTEAQKQAGVRVDGLNKTTEKLVDFIVKNRLTTPAKAQAMVDAMENGIDDAITASGNPIVPAPQLAQRYLRVLRRSAAEQGLPAETVGVIESKIRELMESSPLSETVTTTVIGPHPQGLLGPSGRVLQVPVPVQSRALRTNVTAHEALDSARASSRWRTRDKWGQQQTGATEAVKGVERAQRDAVKLAVPGARGLLRTQGNAIRSRNALNRMEWRQGNTEPFSPFDVTTAAVEIGSKSTGGIPVLAIARHILRSNKMRAGIMADRLGSAIARNDTKLAMTILDRTGMLQWASKQPPGTFDEDAPLPDPEPPQSSSAPDDGQARWDAAVSEADREVNGDPAEAEAREYYERNPLRPSSSPSTTPRSSPLKMLNALTAGPSKGVGEAFGRISERPSRMLERGDIGPIASAAGNETMRALFADDPARLGDEMATRAGMTLPAGGRAAMNLAGDIALDPTNLVPGKAVAAGLGMAVGRGVKVGMRAAAVLPDALSQSARHLSEPARHVMADAIASYPTAARMLSALEPFELQQITKDASLMRDAVKMFDDLPSVAHVQAMMKAGAAKRGWYLNSTRALKSLAGDDADMLAGVIASMSPQTSVQDNFVNALNVFVNWKKAGRPTDEASILKIMSESVMGSKGIDSVLDAWAPNTIRALQGDPAISGAKVDSFWLALRDRPRRVDAGDMSPQEAMVLDAWMGNIFGVQGSRWSTRGGSTKAGLARSNPGYGPLYAGGAARTRESARGIGMSGREGQETAWALGKALYEKSTKTGLTARQIIEKNLLTEQDLLDGPDFASLLRDDRYRSVIMRDPELAANLPAVDALEHTTYAPLELSGADKAAMLENADRLDALRSMRDVGTDLGTGVNKPQSALAVTSQEARGGRGSTLMPGYASLPRAGKGGAASQGRASRTVFAALEDRLGRNRLIDSVLPSQSSARADAVGMWRAETGRVDASGKPITRVETNPAAVHAARMPTANGALDAADETRLRAATTAQGVMTGQDAVVHHALEYLPSADGATALRAEVDKLSLPQVKSLERRLGTDWAVISTGSGVNLLKFSGPVTVADHDRVIVMMKALTKEKAPVRYARNVADQSSAYRQLPSLTKTENKARTAVAVGPGSDWSKLTTPEKTKLSLAAQRSAQELLAGPYAEAARRAVGQTPVKRREIALLEVIARDGLTGLEKALGDPSQVLPAIAGLGILGGASAASRARRDRSEPQ